MKENNIKDYLSIKPSVLFKVHLIQNKVNIQLKKKISYEKIYISCTCLLYRNRSIELHKPFKYKLTIVNLWL